MESYIKLTSQSQGRDRVFRATQYACALLKYLLRNNSERKQLVEKLRNLESTMSSGRKLFRLGNTVGCVDAAAQALQLSDPTMRLLLTATNLGRALYFLCDNALWAGAVGLLRGIDRERWSHNASRLYLISLVLGLARDAYAILQVMAQATRERKLQEESHTLPFLLYEPLKGSPAVALDTAKNMCDLFVPMERLGLYQTNAGVVGLCGLISSLIGILTVLKPGLKLKP